MVTSSTQISQKQPLMPAIKYVAHRFTLALPETWEDKTVYTLTGPVEDGIQHNVVITLEHDSPIEAVRDYAEWQIRALEDELKSCRLLKKGEIKLTNGLPAYRAIFTWWPTEKLRVYQEQIFVLTEKTAYKLTATFTKKTRKTLGPLVEKMMLSFTPSRTGNAPGMPAASQ
jgi:hypothetical protein